MALNLLVLFSMISKNSEIRWSSILVGVVVCLALQLAFGLLAGAIGLTAFQVEQGDVPERGTLIGAGIFGALAIVFSFFAGGYFAARLAGPRERLAAVLHGVTSWGVVALAVVLFVGGRAGILVGSLVEKAGLGVTAATGLDATLRELKRLNPRLVSNIHLKDGMIVTEVVTNRDSGRGLASEAKKTARKAEKEVAKPENKEEFRETAGDVRKVAAGASWIALAGLLGGALAAAGGGAAGGRRARIHAIREPDLTA